jgi:hypothetical protein
VGVADVEEADSASRHSVFEVGILFEKEKDTKEYNTSIHLQT